MAMETRSDHGTPVISGTPVIGAEGRLDSACAQVFHDRLDYAIETAGRAVVIDMENLSYISSAGLRVNHAGREKDAAAGRSPHPLLPVRRCPIRLSDQWLRPTG